MVRTTRVFLVLAIAAVALLPGETSAQKWPSSGMMSTRAFTKGVACNNTTQDFLYKLRMQISADHLPITQTIYIKKIIILVQQSTQPGGDQDGIVSVYRGSDHSMLTAMAPRSLHPGQWQVRTEDFSVPFVLTPSDSLIWEFTCVGRGGAALAGWIFFTFSP